MAKARAAWPTDPEAGVGGIAPERLVFLDECGVLTNMARLYGRSPRGTRAPGSVPCGRWERLSVLGALGQNGMVASMSIQAATDGAVFCAYLEQVLLPELQRTRPDAVIVMDNLGAHKTPEVRAFLGRSGSLPLPAALLAGPQPDRARLGQGEGPIAQGCGADGGPPSCRPRPGAGRHQPPGRQRLLPPCRLRLSQLACGLL